QAEDGIRDRNVTGVQTCALPISKSVTGEEALKDKVTDFVAGLGQVQDALAATGRYSHPGFLAAYGEWQFSRLEGFAPYGEIWARSEERRVGEGWESRAVGAEGET